MMNNHMSATKNAGSSRYGRTIVPVGLVEVGLINSSVRTSLIDSSPKSLGFPGVATTFSASLLHVKFPEFTGFIKYVLLSTLFVSLLSI